METDLVLLPIEPEVLECLSQRPVLVRYVLEGRHRMQIIPTELLRRLQDFCQ